jgi:hypothetical protein
MSAIERVKRNIARACYVASEDARDLVELLAASQQRVAGQCDHIKNLESEVEQLRAIKFKRFNNEDCWIYQGDGEDHLESLVCPVVVSPQKMIELETARHSLAGQIEFSAGVIDQLRDKNAELEGLLQTHIMRIQELQEHNERLVAFAEGERGICKCGLRKDSEQTGDF